MRIKKVMRKNFLISVVLNKCWNNLCCGNYGLTLIGTFKAETEWPSIQDVVIFICAEQEAGLDDL